MKHTLTLLTALQLVSLTAVRAAPPTTANLFDAAALVPSPQEEVFPARDGKAEWALAGKDGGNLTFFSGGLDALQMTGDGAVKFVVSKDGALIGWGNYEGKQPHAERVHLWTGPMTVSVRMKASAPVNVTFLPWCDGVAGGKVPEGKATRAANRRLAIPQGVSARVAAGDEWQTVSCDTNSRLAKPQGVSAKVAAGDEWQTVPFNTDSIKHSDGLELEFAGAEGTAVTMESVRFMREMTRAGSGRSSRCRRAKSGGRWLTWA